MSAPPWTGCAFVANPGDVPLTLVPSWITGLAIQVAWGTAENEIPDEWLVEAHNHFQIYGWAWCQGADLEYEAEVHAGAADRYGCVGFCANMEEPYDAHGNSSDPKYQYPRRYLDALPWDGPLALTTTWSFGSDMTAWQQRGALTMPQAFTAEVPSATLDSAVNFMEAWGWQRPQIRPLIQAYPTNEVRPDASVYAAEAQRLGVGVVPYTVEQAMDDEGRQWLETVRAAVEYPSGAQAPPEPTPEPEPEPEPEPPPVGQLIGSQHGVTAMCENWRSVWPQWTKQNRDPNNLSTWGSIDKLERTLLILAQDHDANLNA